MMEILVIGGGCPDCDKLYHETLAAVAELGLDAQVGKVEDLVEMVKLGIMSVPALMVDGKVVSAGRALSRDKVKKLLNK